MNKTKTIAILTSHNQDFDFEYIHLVEGITQHYNVHLICNTAYQGKLCSLDLTLHRIDCKSKLDFTAIRSVRSIIKKYNIDVLYTQTNRLLAIAVFSTYGLKKYPNIFVRRGICSPVHKYRIEDFLTYFSKRLCHVMTISKAAKRSLVEGGYPAHKITTVHPGLSVHDFPESVNSIDFRHEQEIPKDATIVMCIANKRFVKGLDRIFDAAEALENQNLYWCLIGWGCDQRLLDELKREKPEKVKLLGFIEDAYRYLNACDIYVQPSRMEGLSYSLMQAILKGRCPVISEAGGMSELVEPGYNGLTFSNNDKNAVSELVTHVETLINNPEYRQTLQSKGLTKLETDFSVETMLKKTLKIFDQYN